MYLSSAIMTVAMMTMGGLGIGAVTDARKNGIIAMMALFPLGFSTGWAPLSYVVTTEISALRLRDLTSRVGFTTNVIMKYVWSQRTMSIEPWLTLAASPSTFPFPTSSTTSTPGSAARWASSLGR